MTPRPLEILAARPAWGAPDFSKKIPPETSLRKVSGG
jgi:hypothetical protein